MIAASPPVPRLLLRRRAARVLTALLCTAATLAGCARGVAGHGQIQIGPPSGATPTASGSGAPRTDAPAARPITFRSCTAIFTPSQLGLPSDRAAQLEFGCAAVSVPLGYDDPTGAQIQIALVRVHDRAASNQRPLLVNPGGPGGSGFQLALGLAGQIDRGVLARFDLIGFDPRGVGLSTPLHCISDAQKDALNSASPDVLTEQGFATAKQLAAQVAKACTDKYGAALAQYNTVNTARDMDVIRRGLGAAKTDFLGFSYGTELGSVYAHLFPKQVGAMVLDGAVDPLTDDLTSFADQLDGFEKAFDQFAANCATLPACASLGSPRQVVAAVVAQADRAPLATGTSRPLTSALALTGVLQALYSSDSWPRLASALGAARSGNGAPLLALADEYNERIGGTYTNIMDANTAISCNDAKPGPTDDTIRRTATDWSSRFPMFGRWAAASLFTCQQWQPLRTPPPLPTAATDQPVLVVGNLNDPATPYQGAIELAKTMGNAVLLSWDGEGHTSYLQGSSCVDDAVNAYLTAGTVPAAGTRCPR